MTIKTVKLVWKPDASFEMMKYIWNKQKFWSYALKTRLFFEKFMVWIAETDKTDLLLGDQSVSWKPIKSTQLFSTFSIVGEKWVSLNLEINKI